MAGFTFRIRTADYTETDVVVRVSRIVPVTVRRPAVPGIVVPAAATFHAVGALCASLFCIIHHHELVWQACVASRGC